MTKGEVPEGKSGTPPDESRRSGGAAPVEPTLRAFYESKRFNTAQWFKALKNARVALFPQGDMEAILRDIDVLDPALRKTIMLAEAPNAPHAVQRWTGQVVQKLLSEKIGEEILGQVADSRRLSQLLRSKSFDLHAKGQLERKRAENLLRLVIGYHLDGGRHLLGPVLLSLMSLTARGEAAARRSAAENIERRLRKAAPSLLEAMGAVWAFAEDKAEELRGDRDRLRIENGRLERSLAEQNGELERERRKVVESEARCAVLVAELAEGHRVHAEQLQVAHVEGAAVRDRARTFLDSRLHSLLDDAVAGLEIARIDAGQLNLAIGVVGDRLQEALKAIGEEAKWLKSSA